MTDRRAPFPALGQNQRARTLMCTCTPPFSRRMKKGLLPVVFASLAVLCAGCAGVRVSDQYATPPRFAIDAALGDAHAPTRFRLERDASGRDCNDYAYDAAKAHDARLMVVTTDRGELHMVAEKNGTVWDSLLGTASVQWWQLRLRGYHAIEVQQAPGSPMWLRIASTKGD